MMKTVIGLFWSDEEYRNSLQKLEEAGFARESISTPGCISRDWLAGDLGHPVVRYLGWGSIIGIGVFGAFGLVAALTGCNCLGYGFTFGVATLTGFVVVGGLVGALLAVWIAIDALEKDTHLYIQGVNRGGKLVTVRSTDEQTTKATEILRDGNGVGIAVLAG
jgi:hypothetical protein